MPAYYNEIDPYAAQWLRNLIASGLLPDGVVDERPVQDIKPYELASFTACHFFAGIGGWAYALRLADWPDHRQVWTGSCPCQPFSLAGKRGGVADDRHLWPYWFHLIRECRPPIIFGEQVAAAIGGGWLDAVFADLEGEGYACGAAVLPACSVGAPHIRQRLWFVADTNGRDASAEGLQRSGEQRQQPQGGRTLQLADAMHAGRPEGRPITRGRQVAGSGGIGELADALQPASQRRAGSVPGTQAPLGGARELYGRGADGLADGGEAGELGHPLGARLQERERDGGVQRETLDASARQAAVGGSDAGRMADPAQGGRRGWPEAEGRQARHDAARSSPWLECEWLPCTDGKARPVESGTFPLAHGIPGRVGRLRAYGNAIVPQVAEKFIRSCNKEKTNDGHVPDFPD